MRPGGLVFPLPARYFDDMIDACIELAAYYSDPATPVKPLFVATMKRPYLFENSRDDYGEFECGDRFLFFSCPGECLCEERLFCGRFPSPEILRELQWEGHSFQLGLVPVDDFLSEILAEKFAGIDFDLDCGENRWVLVESFAHYTKNTYKKAR